MATKQGKTDARETPKFRRMREKVEQWCRDYWRPYHGSLALQDDDGLLYVSNRSFVEGHYPLNTAIEDLWKDGKLRDSKRLFGRVLAGLGSTDRIAFEEIKECFSRYGASDSNLDDLKKKSKEFGRWSDSARKLVAIERGIDKMTEALIAWKIDERDFWAEFPHGVPTQRELEKQERYRNYYLFFIARCEEFAKEQENYRTRAYIATKEEFRVSRSVVEEAVKKLESGYIMIQKDYQSRTPDKSKRKNKRERFKKSAA